MPTTQPNNKLASSKLDRQTLERIVEAACLAPSAENTQPWHFKADDDGLTLCLDQSRMLASDVDAMLDLTGLGASLENAVIAAREFGIEPAVEYLRETQHDESGTKFRSVARLTFEEVGQADPHYWCLASRCTKRRMAATPIEQQQLNKLANSIEQFPTVRLDWVTERDEIKEVAALAGLGNRIRFEYQPFHQEFYDNIRTSKQEVERTRDGLDLATLQLPPGVASMLTFLRKWPRMRVANWLGFSRSVARQAAAEVRSSGAVGILSVDSATTQDFLEGGRALQRLWLGTTVAGLGFHPAAALPVFVGYAERTDGTQLLEKHQRLAYGMKERLHKTLPQMGGRVLQMVFRLGNASPPKVRSLRRNPSDVLELTT